MPRLIYLNRKSELGKNKPGSGLQTNQNWGSSYGPFPYFYAFFLQWSLIFGADKTFYAGKSLYMSQAGFEPGSKLCHISVESKLGKSCPDLIIGCEASQTWSSPMPSQSRVITVSEIIEPTQGSINA